MQRQRLEWHRSVCVIFPVHQFIFEAKLTNPFVNETESLNIDENLVDSFQIDRPYGHHICKMVVLRTLFVNEIQLLSHKINLIVQKCCALSCYRRCPFIRCYNLECRHIRLHNTHPILQIPKCL
jgi:hypothetical protein